MYTPAVVLFLDTLSVAQLVRLKMRLEVDPGDGRGGNGVRCGGKWGLGTVVENVKATNAVVEIVVGEKLGEVHGLVLHCNEGLVTCWVGCGVDL